MYNYVLFGGSSMNSKLKKSISMLLVAVLVFGLVGSAGMLPVMAKD